jgi:hypothetical protein
VCKGTGKIGAYCVCVCVCACVCVRVCELKHLAVRLSREASQAGSERIVGCADPGSINVHRL